MSQRLKRKGGPGVQRRERGGVRGEAMPFENLNRGNKRIRTPALNHPNSGETAVKRRARTKRRGLIWETNGRKISRKGGKGPAPWVEKSQNHVSWIEKLLPPLGGGGKAEC